MYTIREWNRAALMTANVAMTLADNLKVKNQMDAITLAKSATYLLGGNASFRFTLFQMFFLLLFQVLLELLASDVGNNSIFSGTSHSDEISFIDKALKAYFLCSRSSWLMTETIQLIRRTIKFRYHLLVNDLVII